MIGSTWLKRVVQKAGMAIAQGGSDFWNVFFVNTESDAGISVSHDTALDSTAVFACVRRISQGIAMLPKNMMRKDGRSRHPQPEHPAHFILHDEPNPEISSFDFFEMQQATLLLHGNCFAEIERDKFGAIKGLWPIPAHRVTVERKDPSNAVWYGVEINGTTKALRSDQVLHVKGFSKYGLLGMDPLRVLKNPVGLDLAQSKFQSKFFSNNAQPGGVIEHPGTLKEAAQKRLKKSWEVAHQGLDQAHRVAVLEEGMQFKTIGTTPDVAKLLEGRTFQLSEVSRVFDVPLHMIGDLSRATFSNIEQQSLEYVIFCLGPWIVRWEQRLNKDLRLPSEKRSGYYYKFVVDALLRGDYKTRMEGHAIARQWGWSSANDVLELEDRNPLPGKSGDIYLVPFNMANAETLLTLDPSEDEEPGPEPDPETDPEPEIDPETPVDEPENNGKPTTRTRKTWESRSIQARVRTRKHFRGVMKDGITRVIRAETREIKKQIKKLRSQRDLNDFREWVEDFYSTFGELVERTMKPLLLSYAEQMGDQASEEVDTDPPDLSRFMEDFVNQFVKRHTKASEGQMTRAESFEEVEAELERWNDSRADKVADGESVRLGEAVTLFVFAASGKRFIQWVANSGACPLCEEMDGRVVGIEEAFVPAGGEVDPGDGETSPLTSSGNVFHPPLHGGCECALG